MEFDCIMKIDGGLEHSGIKGMKWGIRRFQNKDGSLTPAGRKRYADELKKREKSIRSRERAKAQQDKLNAKKAELDAREKALEPPKKGLFGKKKQVPQPEPEKRKSAKDMTDEELDAAIARALKEDEYNRLRPAPQPKRDFKDMLLQDVVTPALTEYGKKALGTMMTTMVDKAVKKVTGDKVDPNSMEELKKKYDKLKLQTDIDKLEHPEKYMTWDDKQKQWNIQKEKEQRKAEAAKKKEEAKAAAKKEKEQRKAEAAKKKEEAEAAAKKEKERQEAEAAKKKEEAEAAAKKEKERQEAEAADKEAARLQKVEQQRRRNQINYALDRSKSNKERNEAMEEYISSMSDEWDFGDASNSSGRYSGESWLDDIDLGLYEYRRRGGG